MSTEPLLNHVACDFLRDFCPADGIIKRRLKVRLMEMVTPAFSVPSRHREAGLPGHVQLDRRSKVCRFPIPQLPLPGSEHYCLAFQSSINTLLTQFMNASIFSPILRQKNAVMEQLSLTAQLPNWNFISKICMFIGWLRQQVNSCEKWVIEQGLTNNELNAEANRVAGARSGGSGMTGHSWTFQAQSATS